MGARRDRNHNCGRAVNRASRPSIGSASRNVRGETISVRAYLVPRASVPSLWELMPAVHTSEVVAVRVLTEGNVRVLVSRRAAPGSRVRVSKLWLGLRVHNPGILSNLCLPVSVSEFLKFRGRHAGVLSSCVPVRKSQVLYASVNARKKN